jgi:hypothetical protein
MLPSGCGTGPGSGYLLGPRASRKGRSRNREPVDPQSVAGQELAMSESNPNSQSGGYLCKPGFVVSKHYNVVGRGVGPCSLSWGRRRKCEGCDHGERRRRNTEGDPVLPFLGGCPTLQSVPRIGVHW